MSDAKQIAATIEAWRRYGVKIESDSMDHWQWAEVSEDGEWTGAFSPAFSTFEACVGDLIACFGAIEDQQPTG